MVDLIDAPFVHSVGWALVHSIWQCTAIGIATALALRATPRAGASARYLVACAGLAMMLSAPMTSVASGRPSQPGGAPSWSPSDSRRAPDEARIAPIESGSTTAARAATTRSLNRALPLAVAGWILGVLLLSLRLVAACVGIERLKRGTRAVDDALSARVGALAHRLGVRRPVKVVQSTLVRVPTVVGWLRPAMLLPASVITGMPAAHLDAVLAHELAHVRRHDFLVNTLQTIVETLLFYHPAVWWCSRQIRVEREHCCDDIVVEACGDRLAYATALASLEELRGLPPVLSLRASGGRLVDRIRRVLGREPADEVRAGKLTIAAAATLVAAVVLSPVPSATNSSALAQAQPPDETPQAEDASRTLPEPPGAPIAPSPPRPTAPAPPALPLAAVSPAQPPAVPQPLEPPASAADFDDLVARAWAAVEAIRFDEAQQRQAIEAALEKLAAETGGLWVVPAPPAPPDAPPAQATEPSDAEIDAIRELVDQFTATAQALMRQAGELRRAEQQLQLRRMELLAAQKQLEGLRERTLEQQTSMAAMRKALREAFANAEALRAIEPHAERLREQIEALRKHMEEIGARNRAF